MQNLEVFWVVWNPSAFPPRVRHSSYESARTEAKRLARANPDQQFFVLKSVGCAQRETVSWVGLHDDDPYGDGIPF